MTKILAIDDKNDNLITIKALINDFLDDCIIITAQTGEDGIVKAMVEQPDVIILDVKMPKMDGFEVCSILKSENVTSHIPIILLTAIKTDIESKIKGLETGADAFLTKPIDESELIAQINVMLRIKKAEDLLREKNLLLEDTVIERTIELNSSEKKLKKERDFLKSLEDASPAFYMALDKDGKILTINKAMLDATGYKLNKLKGQKYFDVFITPDNKERLYEIFNKVINSNKPGLVENIIIDSSKGEIFVEWHIKSFFVNKKLEFVFYVGIDITERKRLENVIITSDVKIRKKISQELHDGLGQDLAGIAFKGEILRLKMKEQFFKESNEINEIVSLINDSIDKTRILARNLCPVDKSCGGLNSAIENLRLETENQFKINCLLQWNKNVKIEKNLEASNLFYIIKEAVENSINHGKAKNIIIILSNNNNLINLKIIDDGIGITDNRNPDGVGLKIMRYRAWTIGATLEIKQDVSGGTLIECILRENGQLVDEEFEKNIKEKLLKNKSTGIAKILIVDDSPIVRHGLVQVINNESALDVCGEAENSDEAIKLISRLDPDLVVIDISLRGSGGVDLIKAIKDRYHNIGILVLSNYEETIYAERAIRVGAGGYIMKQEAPKEVVKAIKIVLNGNQYLSSKLKERFLNKISDDNKKLGLTVTDSLSNREFEIFQLIGQGLSNRHIADRIHISVKTVENFRERIKSKLSIDSSSNLVQFAVQWMINQSINQI